MKTEEKKPKPEEKKQIKAKEKKPTPVTQEPKLKQEPKTQELKQKSKLVDAVVTADTVDAVVTVDTVDAEKAPVIPKEVSEETGVVIRESWKPKTSLGRDVQSGKIKTLREVFDSGRGIMEYQIVDYLLKDPETVFAAVGQSRGKFGGGKRSIWKQTQKKTREGNKPKFAILAIIGNKDGYVGMGYGKSKETMPAREKAIRQAKLNLCRVRRGCGSWECNCGEYHSIPFKVPGKCGAADITLIPAPKGTGLCIEKECQNILRLAGIKDIYSKSRNKKTKYNLLNACFNALANLSKMKVAPAQKARTKYIEGDK